MLRARGSVAGARAGVLRCWGGVGARMCCGGRCWSFRGWRRGIGVGRVRCGACLLCSWGAVGGVGCSLEGEGGEGGKRERAMFVEA